MNTGIISKRYAKALFTFAQEKKEDEKVYGEMKILAQNFSDVPALRQALDNPVLSIESKRKLALSAAGTNVSKVFTRFVDLVMHHKREKYLHNIALMYIELYRSSRNIYTGYLTTASAISPAEESKIRKVIVQDKKGTLEFKTQVDPGILGGFILGIDTYRLDASVVTQLKQVKHQFMEKNRKSI